MNFKIFVCYLKFVHNLIRIFLIHTKNLKSSKRYNTIVVLFNKQIKGSYCLSFVKSFVCLIKKENLIKNLCLILSLNSFSEGFNSFC